jgi:hypothetical protein
MIVGDVHLDGTPGAQDAGEHGNALLGEGIGEELPVLAAL